MQKVAENLIPVSIVAAGVLVAGVLLYLDRGCPVVAEEETMASLEAGQKAVDFINQSLVGSGVAASLGEVAEQNGLYKTHLTVAEQEFDFYVTRDGKYLFTSSPIDLDQEVQAESDSEEAAKSDVPDVKLFVMTYCPYGLQAQKGFLPVYNLLGDKADMGVYFVDYIMHDKKEIDENLRQYCIQEGQPEKYAAYLECFVEEGDAEQCLSEAEIDQTELASCVERVDQEYGVSDKYNDESTWLNGSYPLFEVQTDLNEEYGVSGSPTFVINGQVVQISRSPEAIKTAVCEAFNSAPEECSQILSEDVPSYGFGGGTSESDGGSCE